MPASGSPSSARQAPFAGTRAPAAAGRVVSLSAARAGSGDRPWWVPVVHALALLPAVAAVASIMAARTLLRSLRSTKAGLAPKDGLIPSPFKFGDMPTKPKSASSSSSSSLLLGGLGAFLGYRAGRSASVADCSQIRLRTPTRQLECRYLAAPGSMPAAVGDELNLWGTLGRDGVLRAYRLENLSTGASHRVALVRPAVAAAAAASVVLLILILAAIV